MAKVMKANSAIAASIGTVPAAHSFIRNYSYRGYLPDVKQQISDMAVNGSGIRDTARGLRISPTTVIEELKKRSASRAGKHAVAPADATTAQSRDGGQS